MKTSEQINEIAKAMSEAQNKIRPAIKDGINPHFKSKFSSISSIWESLRDPMTSNGLTVWQDVTTHERGVSVETRIVHSSGQWVEFGPLTMPIAKADAQAFGSCISYAKRYALCAAIGIVSSDEDDDGSLAVSRETGEVKTSKVYVAESPPFIALKDKQKEQIRCLVDSIEDKEWVAKILKAKGITDMTEISMHDFIKCVEALEKKVSES